MFGLDAPDVVKKLIVQGMVWAVISGMFYYISCCRADMVLFTVLFYSTLISALIFFGVASVMLLSSYCFKPWLVKSMMRRITWPAQASILDVGCGRGLCLVAAAQQVPDFNELVGIDIWSATDLSDNSQRAALATIQSYVPACSNRVTILNMDARELSFEDARFDVVVSSLAIHNIDTEAERNKALAQILRVTKPGGVIAILDIMRVDAYKAFLLSQGATLLYASPMYPLYCLSTKYVIFKKQSR